MRSKTSFFNPSLLKKDLLRFWPAWAIYTALLLLGYCTDILSFNKVQAIGGLQDSLCIFAFYNLIYGAVVSQLLFGDLFNSRRCNALHALPVRRESWFLTHTLAGLLYLLIPVAVSGAVLLASLPGCWSLILAWMGGLMGQYLLFFAIGLLSAQLAGNRFAALVFYAMINFFSGIVLFLFYTLYLPHLRGVSVDIDGLMFLCPPVWLLQGDWCTPEMNGSWLWGSSWSYFFWLVPVALCFIGIALLLYRKRALECAGDFLAFRGLRPVFLVLYTFSAGAAMQLFCQVFLGNGMDHLFLLVGLVGGFFTGLMLLDRSLQVFRLRSFAKFGALLACFGLTLLLTIWDPIGITTWVPELEDVASVQVDKRYASDREQFAITDPEIIAHLLNVHAYGVDHPEAASNGVNDTRVAFTYKLKNGMTVSRVYHIDEGTLASMSLEYVRSAPQYVFGTDFTSTEVLAQRVSVLSVGNGEITDKETIKSFLDAMYADAVDGNLWDPGPNESHASFHIFEEDGHISRSWTVGVYRSSTHTVRWLLDYYR